MLSLRYKKNIFKYDVFPGILYFELQKYNRIYNNNSLLVM